MRYRVITYLTESISAKRQTRKQWDIEWGRIGIEGNLWWLGSRRANWVAVMGKNMWWWIRASFLREPRVGF